MEMIINRFEKELLRAETSVNTIKAYKGDLNKFYDYIKINLGDDVGFEESLSLIEYKELEEFVFYLEDKEYSRSTINRVIMALKTFFNYYSKYTGKNPAQGLKGYKKTNSKIKKVLTKEEVKKIINQTQTKRYGERFVDFNSQRDRFLFSLLTTTGLRIEEALNIRFRDIEDCGNYKMINIETHEGSTKLNKRIPICEKITPYYDSYMTEYEKKFNITKDCYLIVSPRSGKKIETKVSNAAIKKYCDELEIEGVTNHCFRHYANIALMSVGTTDVIRKKILGWSCKGDMGATVYFHNTKEIDELMNKYCSMVLE